MADAGVVAKNIKEALERSGYVQFRRNAEYGYISDEGIGVIRKVIERHYPPGSYYAGHWKDANRFYDPMWPQSPKPRST